MIAKETYKRDDILQKRPIIQNDIIVSLPSGLLPVCMYIHRRRHSDRSQRERECVYVCVCVCVCVYIYVHTYDDILF